jgi:predicted Zn-dependent protease with MMP-like domain
MALILPGRIGPNRCVHFILYNVRMNDEDFEKLIAEGYEQLPQWARDKIKNVALLVEDEPSKEDRVAEGLEDDETLLGLYKGIPLSQRGEYYGVGMTLPDTITLYKLPILEAAEEDGKNIAQVVSETIWHEFAHHFGMNEGEVRALEKKRFPHTEV